MKFEINRYLVGLFAGLVALATAFSSCDPEDFVDNFNKSYRLYITVNGEALELGTGLQGSGSGTYQIIDTLGADSVAITYGNTFSKIEGLQAFRIQFNRYYTGRLADERNAFHALFDSGQRPWADSTGNGMRFIWRDANLKYWDTAAGDQSNNLFVVETTEEEDDNLDAGDKMRHELTGYFSCRLYDGTGQFVDIDSARYFLFVETTR
jgi:hypothetical protein